MGEMQLSPLVMFHICAGLLGVLSGTAAVTFRKVYYHPLVSPHFTTLEAARSSVRPWQHPIIERCVFLPVPRSA